MPRKKTVAKEEVTSNGCVDIAIANEFPEEIVNVFKLLGQLPRMRYVLYFSETPKGGGKPRAGMVTSLVAQDAKGNPHRPTLGMMLDFMVQIDKVMDKEGSQGEFQKVFQQEPISNLKQ